MKVVSELFLNGFAKLTNPPFVVNPFSVSVQSCGKKRLIADLRHLNQFLKPEAFKMDDYRLALRRANFMFGFDLEKGYYHVDLSPEVQKFFGFCFKFQNEVYYGYYMICPLGHSI